MRRNSNPIPQPKFYSNLIEQIPESDYTLTQPNFEVYDEEIQERLKNTFLNHGRAVDEDSEDSMPGKAMPTNKRKREDGNFLLILFISKANIS